MNKEQLIKMIELLPVEEITGFKLSYYSIEKPDKYNSSQTREEHIIKYGADTDQKILRKIEDMEDVINHNAKDLTRVGDMVQRMGEKQ